MRVAGLMLCLAAGCFMPKAHAQVGPEHNELALVLGEGNPTIDMAGIAIGRAFSEWQLIGCQPLAEASLEGWRDRYGDGQRATLTTVGALGACRFRLFRAEWLSGEVGIGARLLSHTQLGPGSGYSTAFQFQEILGLRARLDSADRFFLSLRLRHVSNADIKKPNPGITGGLVSLGLNF